MLLLVIEQLKLACHDDSAFFPPVAITQHDRSGRSALVRLAFASSQRHGLPFCVSCIFRIDVHDVSSWRFAVHVAAAIQFGNSISQFESAPFRPLGEAFQENELVGVCVSAAYAAVLAALEECAAGLGNSDAPRWIDLEGC